MKTISISKEEITEIANRDESHFGLVISEGGNYLKVVLPHLPLAAPTVAIMEFLKSHDRITNRQTRDITGIKSENFVKVEFYKLRDEGHIERIPGLAGPNSAWRLMSKGKRLNTTKAKS